MPCAWRAPAGRRSPGWHQAARRTGPGHDQELVADVGIADPVRLVRLPRTESRCWRGPRSRHCARCSAADDVRIASPIETAQPAASASTLVRRGRSSRSRTTCARPPEQLGAADGLARIVAERLDVDRRRGVEHEPQRFGTLEHRGRRLLGEREEQAQARRPAAAARPPPDGRAGARRGACSGAGSGRVASASPPGSPRPAWFRAWFQLWRSDFWRPDFWRSAPAGPWPERCRAGLRRPADR